MADEGMTTVYKWIKDIPNKRGWYWAYEDLPLEDADVLCVWYNGEDKCYAMNVEFSARHFSHWMGPLEPPQTPDILVHTTVVCDRCGETVKGMRARNFTSGYYVIKGYWKKFSNEGENVLCDNCMKNDERYKRVYLVLE